MYRSKAYSILLFSFDLVASVLMNGHKHFPDALYTWRKSNDNPYYFISFTVVNSSFSIRLINSYIVCYLELLFIYYHSFCFCMYIPHLRLFLVLHSSANNGDYFTHTVFILVFLFFSLFLYLEDAVYYLCLL